MTDDKRRAYQRAYYLSRRDQLLSDLRDRWASDEEWRESRKSKATARYHEGKSHASTMLQRCRSRAAQQGIPCTIDASDIIIPDVCPVLGIPLVRSHSGVPTANSPSVDRIIPALGYVPGNVQVISQKANSMKNDASPEELVTFARWVLNASFAAETIAAKLTD